jgi:hypothetical protein
VKWLADIMRQSKIGQFDSTIRIDQDIVALDITMIDFFMMQIA